MTDWTAEEEQAAAELGWAEFKERHPGRSYAAWRSKRYHQGRLTYVNKKPVPTEDDLEAYFAKLEEASALSGKLSTEQGELTIRVEDDRPVAIAFTGDWHAGHEGTDYQRLRADLDALAGAEGVFVIGMGDYKHNAKVGMRGPGNGAYESSFANPETQAAYVKRRMDLLRGKWIGLVNGNHDAWDYKTSGLDGHPGLCEWLGTANLGHGGIVHVDLNGNRYSLGVRHKYKGASAINTTNNQRRFYDEYPSAENLDVIALGHLHHNDLQKVGRRGHKTVFLRSGTYLVDDEYAAELGGLHGEIGVPLAILLPHRHGVIPVEGSDLEEGLVTLRALRATYRGGCLSHARRPGGHYSD